MYIEQIRKNYEATINSYKLHKYDQEYKLGSFWVENKETDLKLLYESKTDEEMIQGIDKTIQFSITFPKTMYDSQDIRTLAVDYIINKQKENGLDLNSYPLEIQESPFINSENRVTTDNINRPVSPNFLRSVSETVRIKEFAEKTDVFLELGAGMGVTARCILLMLNPKKYYITDLPETLCFSFLHLNLCFPEKKHLWITCEEDLAKVEDCDIIYVPTMFMEKLPNQSFDVFLNTASMGEMKNEVIRYWMNYIQNVADIKFLYTLNRFCNTVVKHESFLYRLDENEGSVHYDDKWDILSWELEPHYVQCPYIDPVHARYLEICAKRPVEIADKVEKSEELLKKATLQDWYTQGKQPCSNADNSFAVDRTKTGALFQIWESIRLNPNKNNVEAMLKYLLFLVHDPHTKALEEVYYYAKLLETMRDG